MKAKVTALTESILSFDNGFELYSEHEQDCCEAHYLDFSDLKMEDFEGLEFDLTSKDFFRRVEDYGIELVPLTGWSVKVPGYGSNNGYYSDQLDLVVSGPDYYQNYNITDCQDINY